MTTEELERHTQALWELFGMYVQEHGLSSTTTGVLVVRAIASEATKPPPHCIAYAGDPKEAVATMTRASMELLKKCGFTRPKGKA